MSAFVAVWLCPEGKGLQLPSFSEVRRAVSAADREAFSAFRIALLRNITLDTMIPYLEYLGVREQLDISVHMGGFDNIAVEVLTDSVSSELADADLVLMMQDLETLSPPLASEFASLDSARIDEEIERVVSFRMTMVDKLRSDGGLPLLINAFEPPLYPALGILDAQRADGQKAAVLAINSRLRERLRDYEGVYFLDLDAIRARLGAGQFYDHRYRHMSRAPYSRAAVAEMAVEIFKFVRALRGRVKKCLVLDCDNTLWGGVVGEDGVEGIRLGQSYPGSAYLEFQREIKNLHDRGVILALNSKNNEQDVWQVFEQHPDMVLRREHISASRINWGDKAANIRELAEELNIGLDSMVFVDDNPVETGLVGELLPMVDCLTLPATKPVMYRELLSAMGVFDSLTLSDEDRKRGAMYRAEAERRELKASVGDLSAYFKGLEMTVEVSLADTFSIPRVAQLTQKTNQFNLTTKRYSESDIAAFCEAADSEVVCVKLSDRYGDYGIVGAAIIVYSKQGAEIDSLMVSCRALGRGVEEVFLNSCLELVGTKEVEKVFAHYRVTEKNAQVREFYDSHGFEVLSVSEEERRYCYLLSRGLTTTADHFVSVVNKL